MPSPKQLTNYSNYSVTVCVSITSLKIIQTQIHNILSMFALFLFYQQTADHIWHWIFCPCDSKAPFHLPTVAVITLSIVLHFLFEHCCCSSLQRDFLQSVVLKCIHEMKIVMWMEIYRCCFFLIFFRNWQSRCCLIDFPMIPWLE